MFVDFTQNFGNCDTKIIVQNETLYVHKIILSLSSPVFKAMLNSNFRESNTNVIELPGKAKASIIELLSQIYPDPKPLDESLNILILLSLIREYQINGLRYRVDEYLCKRCESSDDMKTIDWLLRGQEFQLHKLCVSITVCLAGQLTYEELKKHPRHADIEPKHSVVVLEGQIKRMKKHVEDKTVLANWNHQMQLNTLSTKHSLSFNDIANKTQKLAEVLTQLQTFDMHLPRRSCPCTRMTSYCAQCTHDLATFIEAKTCEMAALVAELEKIVQHQVAKI